MPFLIASAVSLSAFLLFWLELFLGKLLLPHFGGGAHIWTTCLAVFQLLLLLGYAYAWAVSHLRLSLQATMHVLFVIAAISTLPLSLRLDFISGDPSIAISITLIHTIGLPMVCLSTTSAVLQSWYSRATQRNPYFLYTFSNAGALCALCLYPGLFEPRLDAVQQSNLWSLLFVVSGIMTCAVILSCYAMARPYPPSSPAGPSTQITPKLITQIYFYAFIPASLLAGVTNYVTTEIAPNPLFWALFLGIYLFTLILPFLPVPLLAPPAIGNVLIVFSLAFLGIDIYRLGRFSPDLLLVTLVVFGLLSWCYHSRLAALKPAPTKLTLFYLIMVFGGTSGTLFNALLAPLLFVRATEYHFVLAAALPLLLSLQRPGIPQPFQRWFRHWRRWLLVCLCVMLAILYTLPVTANIAGSQTIRLARSFYGSYRVQQNMHDRVLIHGHFLHGRQSLADNDRTPGTYYHPGGPAADVLEVLPQDAQVAVIGLGVGELGNYAKPQQDWTFFELDPLIVDIAQQDFRHLSTMPKPAKIITGDGRLQLAQSTQQYDLIVIDAFNSAAIPTHFLTQEALKDVFLPHLRANGILLLHITNGYLRLEPIIQQLAAASDTPALTRNVSQMLPDYRQTANQWVVLTTNSQALERLKAQSWHNLKPGTVLWTDNFSSLRSVMRKGKN